MQKRSFVILAFGYLAAGALGWLAGRESHVEEVVTGDLPVLSTRKIKGVTAETRDVFSDWVSYRLQKNQEEISRLERGEGILAEVRAELGPCDDPKAEFEKLWKEHLLIPFSQVRSLKEEEEYQKKIKELAVRWGQWLDLDPEGAMDKEGLLMSVPGLAFREAQEDIAKFLFERDGIVETLTRIKEPGLGDRFVYQYAATEIGKGGRIEEAQVLMKLSVEGRYSPLILLSLAGNWDRARADELLAVTPASGTSLVAGALMNGMPKEQLLPWTRALIEEGRLSEADTKRIGKVILGYSGHSGMSLDERFEFANEIRGKLGMRPLREVVLKEWSGVPEGIEDFMKSDSDWAYAFRHGVVSADEVLGAARDFLGEKADDDQAVRMHLNWHLMIEDPVRAREITAGEEERKYLSTIDPRRYFELIEGSEAAGLAAVPDQEVEKSLEMSTTPYLSRYGGNYLTWVDQLQDQDARRTALEAVVRSGGKIFPSLAAEAEELLKKETGGGAE